MSASINDIPVDDREEKKWLAATKNIFDYALKQRPPRISRSEVESLIIGLRSNVTTKRGADILAMLQKYLAFMKSKHTNFMKITADSQI